MTQAVCPVPIPKCMAGKFRRSRNRSRGFALGKGPAKLWQGLASWRDGPLECSRNLSMEVLDVRHEMTTTCFDLPGYRVVRNLGLVRGVTVRSRGFGGQVAATLRSLGGGQIHEYVQLCEETRAEGFDLMVKAAEEMGANAIVGVRYDATELATNMTEVLAYGTAVVVEPE